MKTYANIQKNVLRIVLSAGLIIFLFYTVDVQELIGITVDANVNYLLFALLIALADRVIMAYKWSILLHVKNIHIPLSRLTATYLTSSFLGLFLPATVGGDSVRAFAVVKTGRHAGDVVSSIIVERALGFLSLFVFMLVSILLAFFLFGHQFFDGMWSLFYFFLGLLAVSGLLIATSLNRPLLKILSRLRGVNHFWSRIKQKRLVGAIKSVYDSYAGYRNNGRQLAQFFILSLTENLFPLLWTYVLSLAFDVHVPLLYFFIVVPIVLVLVRLPISVDGFGIQEGAYVFFLSLIGVARTEAFLIGLASHFLAIISILPGGILYALNGVTSIETFVADGSSPEHGPSIEQLSNASPHKLLSSPEQPDILQQSK